MFRSASAAAVAVALTVGGVMGTAGTDGAAPSPAPYVTPTQTPPGQVADAPVVDISAPVLDLQLPVSTLDGTYTDVTGGGQQKIVVATDVLFAFGAATLTPAAKTRIDAAATTLRAQAKGGKVTIDGHTDAKGSDSYNLRLSQQRAEAVRQALQALVQADGITFAVRGRGEADPIASNTRNGVDDPAGRAKNRRVEISF